jgi:hypothetical protein
MRGQWSKIREGGFMAWFALFLYGPLKMFENLYVIQVFINFNLFIFSSIKIKSSITLPRSMSILGVSWLKC